VGDVIPPGHQQSDVLTSTPILLIEKLHELIVKTAVKSTY